jgi:hypothetical protein
MRAMMAEAAIVTGSLSDVLTQAQILPHSACLSARSQPKPSPLAVRAYNGTLGSMPRLLIRSRTSQRSGDAGKSSTQPVDNTVDKLLELVVAAAVIGIVTDWLKIDRYLIMSNISGLSF